MSLSVVRDLEAVRRGLERWLGRRIEHVDRPTPGWSCETVIVEQELVVRLPPVAEGIFPVYDLGQQAAVQQAVGARGVPVAAPIRYEDDPEFVGTPFVVMQFVEGPIPEAFTQGDPWLAGLADDRARRRVWDAFLATVADIHRVDPSGLGLREGLVAEVDHWIDYVGWATDGAASPTLVDVFAWCRSECPSGEPPAGLLWGDVRLGNVVFDPATLAPRAVLDWDMASVGPVELDLGWFLALEQLQVDMSSMSVPGFGSRAEAVRAVEEGVGRPLADLRWYEVFALARAAAVAARIALLFERTGRRPRADRSDRDPVLAAAVARIDACGGDV